jgi:uncharacterized membrane protein
MSATVASSPWPAPSAGTQRPPWRFARMLDADDGRGDDRGALQWSLRRNCSATPRQVLAVYLMVCAVSLSIAGVFSWLGAVPVLAFAGVEMLSFGVALLVYARHAGDRETITLQGDALSVEHRCGTAVERAEFRAAWVRVEPLRGDGSLVELSDRGRQVCVGRYVRAEQRTPLAQELRRALRAASAAVR